MTVHYLPSFEKNVKKASHEAQTNLRSVINAIKATQNLNEIPNLKKLKGYPNAYRIRVTTYRIGLYYNDGELLLSRFQPRKNIYRVFP